ncbi:type II toxin-antitoxin system Phd/YefM family antitoxin [Nocardioides insulae]|uniref:type II toxin-antitoxin system Phd/YefM family antitoxin n=1 Tax=Nocardioides insulae TaxID=394734 RepID=UPI000683F8C2|nr:type II toxin-antitoxin system Phd/YefM family antitoxin [Nocardioides insulae]
MKEIPVTEARAQLSDLVSQVAFGGEPVILTRHGKQLVALVPAELLTESESVDTESTPVDAPFVLDLTSDPGATRERFTIAARDRDPDHP